MYSEISEQEQQQLYETIIQNKETAMLSQYIKEKGRKEGRKEGRMEDAGKDVWRESILF